MNHRFNYHGYPVDVNDSPSIGFHCTFKEINADNHTIHLEHYTDRVLLPSGHLVDVHFAVVEWPGYSCSLNVLPHFALPSWTDEDVHMEQVPDEEIEGAVIFYGMTMLDENDMAPQHAHLAVKTFDSYLAEHTDDDRWRDFPWDPLKLSLLESWYGRQMGA